MGNELYWSNCVEEKTTTIYVFPDGWDYLENEIEVHYNKKSLRDSVVKEIKRLENYINPNEHKSYVDDLIEFLKEIDEEE